MREKGGQMAVGYFIRKGDRTSCGGQVTGGDDRLNMFGFGHAREGDAVTCGVTGKTYEIMGGLDQFTAHGRRKAGTLHSVSSCPCRAQLEHSITHVTYNYGDESPPARGVVGATGQAASHASRVDSSQKNSASMAAAAPAVERCGGSFQLINQRGVLCGSRHYAILHKGSCVGRDILNEEAYSHICNSTNIVHLQIATSAPSPVLE